MMFIIGSRALNAYCPDYIGMERLAKADYDLLMSTDAFNAWYEKNKPDIIKLIPKSAHKHQAVMMKDGKKSVYEIELDTLPSVAYLVKKGMNRYSPTVTDRFGNQYEALSLPDLLATKMSHIHYPIHFEKNVKDYLFLKQYCHLHKLQPDPRYTWLRKKEVMKRVKSKTPKLNMTNSEFFSDKYYKVRYFFIHDDIHYAVKHFDVPVYEMMKDDQSMALCLQSKWDALDYDTKVACVLEESYVIAFERYLMQNVTNPFEAFKQALMRICTTLTSGWFRQFALDNYLQVMAKYDASFVGKIVQAFENNKLNYVDNASEDDKLYTTKQVNKLSLIKE